MKIKIHQTEHIIADFDSIYKYLETALINSNKKELHLFPELFLTGYPLQDLCLQKNFITEYLKFLKSINKLSNSILNRFSTSLKEEIPLFLIGGLHYDFDQQGLPSKITNVIYKLSPGSDLEVIYTKILLPNYDIFDEKKYFTPGNSHCVVNFLQKNIGVLICEDMWFSSSYATDPVELLWKNSSSIDLIINLSASPYFVGKEQKRITRAEEISNLFAAPFIYVNRVGAEDEILFDGRSFVIEPDDLKKFNLSQAKAFEPSILEYNFHNSLKNQEKSSSFNFKTENNWNDLFSPNLTDDHLPKLRLLSDNDCKSIIESITYGFQNYAFKSKFNHFLVALSGGIDSALVLALIKIGMKPGQKLSAIFMPGKFTETQSYDLSYSLAENLNIKIYNLPIKFLHSAVNNAFLDSTRLTLDGLAGENIQSRLRGTLLYALANKKGAMVLNTSNKSEISVGYSTLYGDSVGALSILGDLYKSEVFKLAKYINRHYDDIIPQQIITRPPTAELRLDQLDSDSLPSYDILDSILEGYLSYRFDLDDLIKIGFNKHDVLKVIRLYKASEFKRHQFCPIIKLRPKSFGFGHRIPINYKINNL